MSIEVHCPKCGKVIRAPDDAGGKHGRCPSCKESVYVPLPPADEGEIKLAPLDEEEDSNEDEEPSEEEKGSDEDDELTEDNFFDEEEAPEESEDK